MTTNRYSSIWALTGEEQVLVRNTNVLFSTKPKLHRVRTSFTAQAHLRSWSTLVSPEMTVVVTEICRPKNYPSFFSRSSRLLWHDSHTF